MQTFHSRGVWYGYGRRLSFIDDAGVVAVRGDCTWMLCQGRKQDFGGGFTVTPERGSPLALYRWRITPRGGGWNVPLRCPGMSAGDLSPGVESKTLTTRLLTRLLPLPSGYCVVRIIILWGGGKNCPSQILPQSVVLQKPQPPDLQTGRQSAAIAQPADPSPTGFTRPGHSLRIPG